jgi:hypothetical protein
MDVCSYCAEWMINNDDFELYPEDLDAALEVPDIPKDASGFPTITQAEWTRFRRLFQKGNPTMSKAKWKIQMTHWVRVFYVVRFSFAHAP